MNVCEICGTEKGQKLLRFGAETLYWPYYNCTCHDEKNKKEEENERLKHKKKIIQLRLQESGIPAICLEKKYSIPTKSTLIVDEDTKEPIDKREYEKINKFINSLSSNIRKGISLFIPGNPGTGKTIIIGEIGKLAIDLGFEFKYFTASKIINEKIDISRYRFTDVIAIDDLGMAKIETRDNKLFEFINDRIDNKKTTIISSNSTEEMLKEHAGEALVDRMKMFYICFMIGPSRREFQENLFT